VHILVEGFSVFGVQVQYWMPLAALIVAVAVVIGDDMQRPTMAARRGGG
jgi:hypothetical protein